MSASRSFTPRKLFKLIHSEARKAMRSRSIPSAYLANVAGEEAAIFEHGADISKTVSMSRAVIFALHWQRFPAREDLPRNRSEVHLCFYANAIETKVWFTSPGELLPA